MTAALALVEWLHLGAAMLIFGASAFLTALVPEALALGLRPAARRVARPAVALLVATGIGWLIVQAGLMADAPRAGFDPATVADVLGSTAFGRAWLVHLGLVAALTVAVLVGGGGRTTAVLSGLALASIGLVGHPTMHEGFIGILHRANQMLHMLSAGAWLGSLVPLLALMGRLADPDERADAAVALRRFSALGHGVVALVIVTGVANTVLVVGAVLPDPATLYGRLLLAKLAGVAAMTWLALWNRYILVPGLRSAPAATQRQLWRLTAINIGLGTLVLLLTAFLSLADPMPAGTIG